MTRARVRLLFAIFILSGASGLVYEVVWARQLVLVFGNTTQAVSAILTGFFGGLALGSMIGGRVADRIARPLRLYGLLEVVLVGVVLVTPLTFDVLHELYRGVYPGLSTIPVALALVRFLLAIIALAPATILMGATLPALTRFLTARDDLGGAFSRLYAANTIGAIAGTSIAGFVLIEVFGLGGALLLGASGSGIAGLVALLLDRVTPPRGRLLTHTPEPGAAARPRELRLALALAFLSGLTSVGYQVVWNRLLALGSGNPTYVFTLILTLFLTGLALGALLQGVIRPRVRSVVAVIAGGQVFTAVFGLVGAAILSRPIVPMIGSVLDVSRLLELLGLFALLSAIVVLPATIVMGVTFPATADLVGEQSGHEGAAAGTLLGVNTLGAIVATSAIPFLLFPTIGAPLTLAALIAVNAGVGIWLATRVNWRPVRATIGISGIGAVIATVGLLATANAFRDPTVQRIQEAGGKVFETREDEIAPVVAGIVGATPQIWVTGTSMTLITVDTKLMPVLPLALRPEAERALVVAFGMGTTYRTSLIAGLEVDAIELVPSVPMMFRHFYPDADERLDDPRGNVIVADGRNHVELADETYDIVIVDPPPPIETAGVSVISTVEFYEAAKARLTPVGVMMQWVPYGQTLDEYLAHVRSFAAAFDRVRVIFGPGGYGTYLLGSDGPVSLTQAGIIAAITRPGVLEDVNSAPDSRGRSAEAWAAQLIANTWVTDDEVARVVGDGPLVTDDRPYPEYFLLRRIVNPDAERMSPSSMLRLRQEMLGR